MARWISRSYARPGGTSGETMSASTIIATGATSTRTRRATGAGSRPRYIRSGAEELTPTSSRICAPPMAVSLTLRSGKGMNAGSLIAADSRKLGSRFEHALFPGPGNSELTVEGFPFERCRPDRHSGRQRNHHGLVHANHVHSL